MAAQKKSENTGSDTAQGLSPFRMQMGLDKRGQDAHMNGIAMTLFFVLVTIAVAAAVIMDTNGYPDGTIFAVVIPIMLLAFILMFAIQVAKPSASIRWGRR